MPLSKLKSKSLILALPPVYRGKTQPLDLQRCLEQLQTHGKIATL
jgi:hypothetical protein